VYVVSLLDEMNNTPCVSFHVRANGYSVLYKFEVQQQWSHKHSSHTEDAIYLTIISSQGKAGKYTDYSVETGITKDEGQSTLEVDTTDTDSASQTKAPNVDFVDVVDGLQEYIRAFATARKWTDFHLPRSLVLALMGELGELAELFQWKKDTEQTLTLQEHDKIGQEIADVSIYLIRLADVCGVSLKDAMLKLRNDQDEKITAATTTDWLFVYFEYVVAVYSIQ
jgi:dCTP diphosphatase